jgi:hypothetical protein
MKPVKLYFAGGSYPMPLENRLVSYAYPEQLKAWFKMTGDMKGNIILDSGAFSAWRSGKSIDLDALCEYAHKAIEEGKKYNKTIRVVNLDVIPGKVGETQQLNKVLSGARKENLELIDSAAKAGYKNMLRMIENGITPIHVFHQGEKWKWLDRMVESVPYIGVSPANDMPMKSKRQWMYTVFSYLYKNNIKVDTHGFAVFDQDVIEEFPWTSCDATSPLLLAGYGKIYCPAGGFSNPDYSQKPSHLIVSDKKAINGVGDVTDEKLKQLLGGQYTFEDLQDRVVRVKLNVQFILGLQGYINKRKRKVEFIPKTTLLYED